MALFNIIRDGSAELEELTGQWYASSPYKLISTEVDFAVRDLRERVGDAVVSAAERAYETGDNDELVMAVRLPVACLALMRYMALATLSHEATGRKVKMDDNEKIPFEWMVDRDDRAMRERYYRALDALYGYLEAGKAPEWLETGRKAGPCVVRDMAEFETVYPIEGSHYVYHMLRDLVLEAQDSELAPFLGDAWPSVLDGTASPRVMSLSRKVAVLSAVAMAGERWSLEVFPLTIARRFAPTYQGNRAGDKATTDEIDWYVGKLKAQKAAALTELREVLSPGTLAGTGLLPENDRRKKYFTTV